MDQSWEGLPQMSSTGLLFWSLIILLINAVIIGRELRVNEVLESILEKNGFNVFKGALSQRVVLEDFLGALNH